MQVDVEFEGRIGAESLLKEDAISLIKPRPI
jgi:hypothetical protein